MNDKSTNQSEQILKQCEQTRVASRKLATASTEQKNNVLLSMVEKIEEYSGAILSANETDCKNARQAGLDEAMLDRLTITEETLSQMQSALRHVASLADPLLKSFEESRQPSGIRVTRKSIPLGVILMIYESRPNVTVEAAALAVKSGNAIILRGGKEAFETNQVLSLCWQKALQQNGLDKEAVRVLASTDRALLSQLLTLDEYIDVVIPRGGEGLIRHVVANSHIPVIKHYKGVCHLYVDEFADLTMALNILINGKTQRPGVCNALEGLLVHKSVAKQFLTQAKSSLQSHGVKIYGCAQTRSILADVELATEETFMAEFLGLELSVKVVESIDEAIQFIDQYGSQHTEVIVTELADNAEQFVNQVDASVVMVNASSRFSDGGQLGLGAEIGISTSKLHAYGPMGLESLTAVKFVVHGEGEVRE